MVHYLKTWPQYYHRVLSGEKTFEVRKNDRDFQKGDIVFLTEYDPVTQEIFTQSPAFIITYVLHGGQFGIEPGYVVFGLKLND